MDKDILLKERTQEMLPYIHNHYQDSITIEDIAGAARISRSECFRCFQKYVCQKPFEYVISYRLRKAAELLKTTSLSVSEISTCCGFNYQSYFGKRFQEYYQMTPWHIGKVSARELFSKFSGIFFYQFSGKHHLMSTSKTFQTEICPNSQNFPFMAPTGMLLF